MLKLRHKIALEQKLADLKLRFFTNVSHELRTPLTLILNPIEQIAKKEKLSPEGTAYLGVAQKNANRMIRFVNQLLDLRKVESNKATLVLSRVEVVSFIKTVSDHFIEAIRNKRIRFEIIADHTELFAWIDAEKLDVIIYNLLGNAIKFTPEGKAIKILIQSHPEEESFSIAVHDQGPGIDNTQLKNIFDLFYEGGQSSTRELKGSGIGLALCKEFVHLHGGEIWATNNEDAGLTVSFKLKTDRKHFNGHETSFSDTPIKSLNGKPAEQQVLPLPVNAHTSKGSESPLVLLVEDNEELRMFLKSQLSEYYTVEVACDGKEGLAKANELFPDLIVSDIMMPVMDGIEMLDKVKNDINTSHIPVVLLSAKYSIESQIEGLNYGADYYITKPFNNEFLIASIDNLLRQRKKLFEALIQRKQEVDLRPGPIVVTSKDEAFLKQVINVVDEKMAEPEFNIEAVAEMMHMSRTTFYKKFKGLTGMTPVEFVRDMRLQRAKQYLDAGGNNVSEIAYLSGFASPKYFSTCFREKYHISPSDYLKLKVS
jgi:DNA-binding response OmpR family regulator/two-component sensor histidine kinase